MSGTATPALDAVNAASAAVDGVGQNPASPGTLAAAEGAIQAALTALGNSAAASGAMLIAMEAGPDNIAALVEAAGNSALCAAAWGFTARAGLNLAQVPGISTPGLLPQQDQMDLTQFPGA